MTAVTPISSAGLRSVAGVASPVAGTQATAATAATAGNANVATSFSSAPSTSGGGAVQDMGDAIANMVARSSAKSKSLQDEIDSILKSDGEVSPAKMSLINKEQSQQEMIMQMAKNMQDREERMQRIWVQQ